MNALKEGKTSGRVKNALQLNQIAENNMKTSLKLATTNLNKKELDSLKYKQAFYQQRKKELDLSSPRRPQDRAKSPLSRLPLEKLELNSSVTSFQSITEISSRPRSFSSMKNSPSIEISDFSDEKKEDGANKLPSLTPRNGGLPSGEPLRGRAKSTTDITKDVAAFLQNMDASQHKNEVSCDLSIDEYLAKSRRRSSCSGYLLASPTNMAASKSAPSSPILPRKTPIGSPTQKSLGRKAKKKQTSKEDVHNDSESLADSMNRLKFCRYLRDTNDEELLNKEEKLPSELKPKEVVLGHTKVVF